jgi:dethiobiotin synthetase
VRGLFVTGTDTGVGKSVVAAAACAVLAERGERVAAFKPVLTGLDDPAGAWPHDHALLARTANAGQAPAEVAPLRFRPPVSPHLAAELAGVEIEPARLVAAARRAAIRADAIVVEGVGGLMVPLSRDFLVRDLASLLDLPVLVVARPGLGTINHTLLTLAAAREVGLRIASVVLNPWPGAPSRLEASNRETLERLGGAPIATLPLTRLESLGEAGRELRVERWLGEVPAAAA